MDNRTNKQKAQTILRRAKRYGITTNEIEILKNTLKYAKENKRDIDYNELTERAYERFIKSDDLTKMFRNNNRDKQRIENIKQTMNASGFIKESQNISNQEIVDYVQNIRQLTDNISVLQNLPSEQVGEIYLQARNKKMSTEELINVIEKTKNNANTYDEFLTTSKNLIKRYKRK